jgi:hypothetical protein
MVHMTGGGENKVSFCHLWENLASSSEPQGIHAAPNGAWLVSVGMIYKHFAPMALKTLVP